MKELWQEIYASVFSLTFENDGKRICSGSGFKIGKYLITNNHVIQVPNYTQVVIRSVEADGYSTSIQIPIEAYEFRNMLIDGDPEASWDYAIIELNIPEFLNAPSLSIEQSDEIEIGSEIAFLGYQFDQPNLSIHIGHIASQFIRAGVNYLQLDASVNQGNSGGPLIDVNTGNVIGIITRKATGLTNQFEALLTSFTQSINNLQNSQASNVRVSFTGIDVRQAFLTTQHQMQQVAREIGRSANVGIGYAYKIYRIRSSIESR